MTAAVVTHHHSLAIARPVGAHQGRGPDHLASDIVSLHLKFFVGVV